MSSYFQEGWECSEFYTEFKSDKFCRAQENFDELLHVLYHGGDDRDIEWIEEKMELLCDYFDATRPQEKIKVKLEATNE